jgi:hypothetical protein
MNGYVNFLEQHLGMIEQGWNTDISGEKLPFNIVKYKGGPFPGTVTYSTLGLSHHFLKYPQSDGNLRQELFLVADSDFGEQNIPNILQLLGTEALESHLGYLRGQVIGPRGKLFKDTDLEALYATMPVYFPRSFYEFDDGVEQVPIVQVWLVPITKKEANFVLQNGWSQFEDILEEKDPDLINFKRDSIIS